MIGLLSYLPTVAFIPHLVYTFIFVYILLTNGKNIKFGNKSNLAIILSLIVFSTTNNFAHPQFFEKARTYFPFLILMLITLLASNYFTKKDAKVLVYFIALECIFVIIEFALGISTFFKSLPTYLVYEKSSLLYTNRPYGLSENSSHIALKIFVALTIIKYFNLKGSLINIAKGLLFISCVLTFNRTVIVTLIFFYSMSFAFNSYKIKFDKAKLITIFIILVSITLCFIFYADDISEKLIGQFTRNKGKIELTGRGEIWRQFIVYIQQNFFFGNGSFKYLLKEYIKGKSIHAHNSFLQVLATHGFFIFMLYIILILKNINRHNFIYICTYMLYSMSQYGIFWGISLIDIIFFVFLFHSNKHIENSLINNNLTNNK